jgi:hypothetical protein
MFMMDASRLRDTRTSVTQLTGPGFGYSSTRPRRRLSSEPDRLIGTDVDRE